ncbi:hypothetical protein [Mucilaginibacter aquariorum]|uniref:Uncharacterized protein n=1 Tax=Mucilaginibacter aquariorum TaxID=2967225 RepID=A0ABT1T2A5_9SPHI|nr:hypothetical protein [Mucilaginibacter aquariorum]MCQ6958416.1 hypothetical protein [Mucilaginibacter aquariorum]
MAQFQFEDFKGLIMKIGAELLKVLNKTYAPDEYVSLKFGRNHLVFKTDEHGRPVMLFIGQADENGRIKGERFTRNILTDAQGKIIKDHWDNKDKTA